MKKIKLIALFVPLLIGGILASAASAQIISRSDYESPYFDREDYISADGDTTVSLYEKGGKFTPERRDPGEVFGFRKMGKDLYPFLKREFPDLTSPKDIMKFDGVILSMWVDNKGNIVSFFYWLKSNNILYLYPDMEKHLYNFAMSIKNEGVKKYNIYALNVDSYCMLNYSFTYIYRAFVFPEKE